MDLYWAFKETGLPRDIVGIIIDYAHHNGYPHKITVVGEIRGESGSLSMMRPFKDNIIIFHDASNHHKWFNMDTLASGSLHQSGYVEVISEEEYLSCNGRAVYKENITTSGIQIVKNFEGIISNYLISVKDGSVTTTYVHLQNELFYLPTSGVFALEYVSGFGGTMPDNMLATGPCNLQRLVPMETNAKKITLARTLIRSDLCSNFAILWDINGMDRIIFRDDVTYYGIDAVKFDENSVIFRIGDKFYYRRIGRPLKEIDWPKDIMLSTIRVYKNRIAYQTSDPCSIYIGDIEWR